MCLYISMILTQVMSYLMHRFSKRKKESYNTYVCQQLEFESP